MLDSLVSPQSSYLTYVRDVFKPEMCNAKNVEMPLNRWDVDRTTVDMLKFVLCWMQKYAKAFHHKVLYFRNTFAFVVRELIVNPGYSIQLITRLKGKGIQSCSPEMSREASAVGRA